VNGKDTGADSLLGQENPERRVKGGGRAGGAMRAKRDSRELAGIR